MNVNWDKRIDEEWIEVINMKSKVYNFAENCRNVNYNIKYEISSHKTNC